MLGCSISRVNSRSEYPLQLQRQKAAKFTLRVWSYSLASKTPEDRPGWPEMAGNFVVLYKIASKGAPLILAGKGFSVHN